MENIVKSVLADLKNIKDRDKKQHLIQVKTDDKYFTIHVLN